MQVLVRSEPFSEVGLWPAGLRSEGLRSARLRSTTLRLAELPLVVLVLFVSAGVLTGCKNGDEKAAMARRGGAPAPVVLGVVERRDEPFEVTAIGHVEASATVNVTSRVSGTLDKIAFRGGERVRRGQTLFQIDPRPFRIALARAQAKLAHDQALARNAREELKRYKQLTAKSYASHQQLDRTRASLAALQATLKADQAAIDDARLQLSYCTITSPIDGVTGDLLVHAGNLVKANGDQPLVVIGDDLPVYVRFSVPEQHLTPIRRRMAEPGVELAVAATPTGSQASPAQGVLTFVNNSVDIATGMIELRATFANQRKRLWPGQFVRATLQLFVERGVTVCPARAVQQGQMGAFVFVAQAASTGAGAERIVKVRPVTVARTIDERAIVAKGLQPGEEVVIDGQLRLRDDAPIEVKKAPEEAR